MADWRDFQKDTAELFRQLGFDAGVDVTVQGARARHDIDVLARRELAGLELVWIIECKLWKRRVSKLHVLALRAIAEDIGANLGILISNAGFQRGALEAAAKTNLRLATMGGFRALAKDELDHVRLMQIPPRLADAWVRYWAISKSRRIEVGLRPSEIGYGYSGTTELQALQELFLSTLAGKFPPVGHSLFGLGVDLDVNKISDQATALDLMEQRLTLLEMLIERGEATP